METVAAPLPSCSLSLSRARLYSDPAGLGVPVFGCLPALEVPWGRGTKWVADGGVFFFVFSFFFSDGVSLCGPGWSAVA